MRILSLSRITLLVAIAATLFSCNEKEEFNSEPLTDYMPLLKGKYITYRVDSMVFTEFGITTEIHRYQVRHLVDDVYQDLQGQTTYRIFRSLRDSLGHGPWQPAGTFEITLAGDQIELIENSLRFIKLHSPIREGFTWKGNKYLPYNPYDTMGIKFSNDDDMQDWDFYYDNFSPVFSYRGHNYTDVYTVEEADEAFNAPVTIPTSYGSKNRAFEKYSKGIGLVYREYEMWEYQPNPGGVRGPYKSGFGLTMWMIDHN